MIAGYGRLLEVKKEWDIDDLFDAHEVMDLKEEAERVALERSKVT